MLNRPKTLMGEGRSRYRLGFTLSEVLITLVIIGIVAAITIPTLYASYKKKQYVVQLKRDYGILTNGFKKILADNGVTRVSDTTLWTTIDSGGNCPDECLKELEKTFVTLKKFKRDTNRNIDKIKYKNLSRPGEEELSYWGRILLADGSIFYLQLRKTPDLAYAANGNPGSLGAINVDVNGAAPPNTWGRDLFRFVLFDDGSIVGQNSGKFKSWFPGYHYWKTTTNSEERCSTKEPSYGTGCSGRIMDENWEMTY